jgi:hypothetical protein
MLPEPRPEQPPVSALERRVPGDTDVSIFTTAPPSEGRHRPGPRRRLRVTRDPLTARPSLRAVPILLAAVVLMSTAACGSSSSQAGGQPVASAAAEGSQLSLKGVCPAVIKVQSSWYPQVEHAALYQLLGAGSRIDAEKKSVTGPLVASAVDTGVRLEIRAGGPAIGNQPVSAQMAADPSITIGMLNSDELIQQSQAHPLLGVVAPLEIDPQVIFWDPKAHPDWHTIADIGQTSSKILYFQNIPFMSYLLGAGILRPSQVDSSYDGNPARFVASRGTIAVQGYVTNEPWAWQHEVPQWGKPLDYQLINDTGYPNYANLLAIRPADQQKLDGCLRRLVPIIQRAQVQFMTKPGPAVDLIVKAVAAQHGFTYSKALADYAVTAMRDQGIVANGLDHTLGNFQDDRMQRLITILTPIFTGQHQQIKAGLTVNDLVTNRYIDPTIGLPSK